jgi:hypothetical protein
VNALCALRTAATMVPASRAARMRITVPLAADPAGTTTGACTCRPVSCRKGPPCNAAAAWAIASTAIATGITASPSTR